MAATQQDDTTKTVNLRDIIDCTRHSSLKKFVRVTAYVFPFKNILIERYKWQHSMKNTKLKEYHNAWIRAEHMKLKIEPFFNKQYASLKLFKDYHEILWLRGRFNNADLKNDQKHPVMIRNGQSSYITRLFILDAHYKVLHHGIETTLAFLWSQFWIVKGRRTAKDILRGDSREGQCYHLQLQTYQIFV